MIRKGYQTTDGQFFENEDAAKKHEATLSDPYPYSCAYNGCRGCPVCLDYVYGSRNR
jgi:hypothetical protein